MGDILKLKIQLRRDTDANWVLYDPILLNGEAAVSSDLNKIKIGNGTSKWSELEYMDGEALAGFSTAETGSYPVKQSDGSLKWVKPSELTAEGIQTELTNIKEIISKLPATISAAGAELDNDNGVVNIPIATATRCGLVKGSDEILISEDGTLSIQSMDVSKLTQEDSLVLYGGDAATN